MNRQSARSIVLLVLLLAPAVALAKEAGWPMEGRDAGRASTALVPLPTKDVALAWNGSGQYTTILVATDGSVVGIGDPVTVWEPDGKVRWSTRTVGAQQQVFRARAGALLSDGTIVASGSLPFGAPAVALYDPQTGQQTNFDRNFTGNCDSLENTPIAVAEDDSFYVGACGPGLMAFTKSGAKKWNVTAETERVALGGSHVYARVDDHKLANGTQYEETLVAFSQADGKVVWAAPLQDDGSDPFVGPDGTVYLVDAGYVTAFSPVDGKEKWRTIVARPFALGVAPNGTIAAASANVMSWIGTDGKVLGTSPTKDGRLLVLGDGVHLRSYGKSLAALDASGTLLWEVTTPSNPQSNIAVGAGGAVYVAVDGQMYAYKGTAAAPDPSTPSPTTTPSVSPTTTPDDPARSPSSSGAPGGSSATPAPPLALVLALALALALVLRRRR